MKYQNATLILIAFASMVAALAANIQNRKRSSFKGLLYLY